MEGGSLHPGGVEEDVFAKAIERGLVDPGVSLVRGEISGGFASGKQQFAFAATDGVVGFRVGYPDGVEFEEAGQLFAAEGLFELDAAVDFLFGGGKDALENLLGVGAESGQ